MKNLEQQEKRGTFLGKVLARTAVSLWDRFRHNGPDITPEERSKQVEDFFSRLGEASQKSYHYVLIDRNTPEEKKAEVFVSLLKSTGKSIGPKPIDYDSWKRSLDARSAAQNYRDSLNNNLPSLRKRRRF